VKVLEAKTSTELTLAFVMATFQVSLIVLLAALAIFASGGSFDDLDTATGTLGFLWLWAASFYWTLKAVGNMGVDALKGDPLPLMLSEGIKRGAMAGITFFAGLLVGVFFVVSLGLDEDPRSLEILSFLVFAIVYLVIGSAVAGIVGGALGFVFAVLYRVLLSFAKLVAGMSQGG
jgi:hypothetical protein